MRNTRAINSLRGQNLELAHFQKCMSLAQNIPLAVLERKFSLSELPNLVELVRKDIKA